jgi:26S proteasome regulatory subunit N10
MSSLEAVMICLDNSEYARNQDYAPSRLEAQTDAANVISGAKTQAHPENVVGVALMSGERGNVEIKLNPCTDIGRVLSVLSQARVANGSEACDLIRSIQTCSIALKHRQNKNQKQRLVLFIASPLAATEKQLDQIGKVLKKNNVAIDVISIGDIDGVNKSKLEKLVSSADSGGSCHFVEVESNSGKHLSDVIISSPILGGGGGFEAGEGGEFGFDANMDPELAMAIRLSMEEERQRQAGAAGGSSESSAPVKASATPSLPVEEDFDAELRAALLASMQEVQPAAPQVDMDEELRKALAESMEDWEGETEAKKPKTASSSTTNIESTQAHDPNFVAELLATLPGVDVNDPRIQEALRNAQKRNGDKK